jgi:hypothetical protein
MNNIKPINQTNYDFIKEQADIKFKRAGIYKDAYILKNYIKMNGDFNDETYNDNYFRRVLKFIAEQWTDTEQYINEHEITPLEKLQNSKVVRPINRVDKSTPPTIHELLQLHGKAKILQLCKDKTSDNKIIWRTGKIINLNKFSEIIL